MVFALVFLPPCIRLAFTVALAVLLVLQLAVFLPSTELLSAIEVRLGQSEPF